jgi:hypothetical protein
MTMHYHRAARSLVLSAFLVGALGGAGAAQVPLLVDGTLMSPLGGETSSQPMPGCETARQRTLTPAEQEAENFRRSQVSGRELHAAIRGVQKSLHWFEDLGAAARTASAQQKPIVWIHLLGELDGFT